MRWRLILIVSLIATIVGAGTALGIVFGLLGSSISWARPNLFVIGALIIPLAAIIMASIFVYRHTARRRPLQAMLTALLTGSLTLTILIASSILFSRSAPAPTPAPRPINIG